MDFSNVVWVLSSYFGSIRARDSGMTLLYVQSRCLLRVLIFEGLSK